MAESTSVTPFNIDLSTPGSGIEITRSRGNTVVVPEKDYDEKSGSGYKAIRAVLVNTGEGTLTFYEMVKPIDTAADKYAGA
ncbi:MAG: hypothetical protein QG621_163 [Patescibacteria group bacterium]|jgi:hypothetical protein|nr:hypothetical protein [Patescibacteria group bacterium]